MLNKKHPQPNTLSQWRTGRGHRLYFSAVLRQFDIGVLENVILLVHHRAFPPDEQQGVVVVQGPHLVGSHQLPTRLLVADGTGAVGAAGHAAVAGVQGLLAQQLGDILVGGRLY